MKTEQDLNAPISLFSLMTGQPKAPAEPQRPIKPWSEIYNQLDPNMPEDQYNALRLQYFNSEVRPRIKEGESVPATYNAFLQKTERPLSIHARQLGESIGRMAVEGGTLMAGSELLGPLMGAAATQLMGESKLVRTAAKIATGGLTFGTYDALKANDGDRVNAAIRGAGWGVVGEGVLEALGHSGEAARNVVKSAMTEKVAPELSEKAAQEAAEAAASAGKGAAGKATDMTHPEPWAMPPSPIADILTRPEGQDLSPEYLTEQDIQQRRQAAWDQAMGQIRGEEAHPTTLPTQEAASKIGQANVEEARKIGMTVGPMRENPAKKGLWITLTNAEGESQVLSVPRGKESEITGMVEATLAKGGSLDDIEFHPASRPRASQFMRYFAEKAESENAPIRMNVPKGTAGNHARNLNRMGLLAQVLDDETIQVGPEAGWKKAQRARELNQRLAQEQAGKVIPPPPDDISKKMMRIGELRNQARLAVSPNEVYTEMHHLAGEVSQHYQLSRTQIGQLALDYFTRNAAQENPESAIPLLEKYRGRGAPFGVVEGEKAPPGMKDLESRLPGFKMPAEPDQPAEISLYGETRPAVKRERPVGTTYLSPESPKKLGFLGRQTGVGEEASRTLSKIDPRLLRKGAFVEPTQLGRDTLFHESIHDGIAHAELHNDVGRFMQGHMDVLRGIGTGLRDTFWAYRLMSPEKLANEVFTWAATALRAGDEKAMARLVAWDESREAIEKMVNTTAGRLYQNAMHSDTAPIRAFLRRMNDLVRRTQPEISAAMRGGQLYGYTTWFDPEMASWVMRDGEGREVLKKTRNEVFDWMDQADPSSHFPDQLHEGYYMGLKGPAVPPGLEPTGEVDTPEFENIPLGYEAFRAFTKPTLDFAAMVQAKLEKFGVKIPFYNLFAEADTARRAANPVMDKLAKDRDTLYKGVSHLRRLDYGEVLARPREQWADMQAALKLTDKDMGAISAFDDWSKANEREGGVSLTDTLAAIRKVREAGGDKKALQDLPETIADAIRHGQLAKGDLHVGRVSQWVIRQSINDRFMSEPLKAIEDLLKIKAKNGEALFKQLNWPLRNYVQYMKGIPDQGQQIMNNWMEAMSAAANKKVAALNKLLPEAWQIAPFSPPRELWSKYQLLMYTAGLGLRPAIFLRDTFQAMHALAVMGPTNFFRGMQMALTPEGRQMFIDAGASIEGRNIGQMFGDVSGDLPVSGSTSDLFVKAADWMLSPSRIGHNVGRSIAYLGEYSNALEQIAAFRRGEIDALQLRDRTSVWFQDPAPRSRLLAMATKESGVPLQEAARQFGLALNDATQFALRSGTQPALLRTGFGRVMGQYGTWPANYLEFLRKGGARILENPAKGVPALGWWLVMQYGAYEGAKQMGIDFSKWVLFSPAGYAGSPNLELLQTLMAAPEESTTGLEARRKLHGTLWEFTPAGVEIQSIMRAINDGEVNVPRLLGFKPLSQQQDQDLEDWLEIESGFKRAPRTP